MSGARLLPRLLRWSQLPLAQTTNRCRLLSSTGSSHAATSERPPGRSGDKYSAGGQHSNVVAALRAYSPKHEPRHCPCEGGPEEPPPDPPSAVETVGAMGAGGVAAFQACAGFGMVRGSAVLIVAAIAWLQRCSLLAWRQSASTASSRWRCGWPRAPAGDALEVHGLSDSMFSRRPLTWTALVASQIHDCRRGWARAKSQGASASTAGTA